MISDEWLGNNLGKMTALRRDFHAHPELGFEEVRTSDIIAEELASSGIELVRSIGVTGIVATIHGDREGPAIGLRADMDALPIREQTGLPYASRNGLMHACGHDGHTVMLLTAARWLSKNRNFNGTVHLIFQPAEEGRGGAASMINDGLFARFPCRAIFGLHNTPGMSVGSFGIRPGAMMAAAEIWEAVFSGAGGHGGVAPHRSQDVTYAMGHFVVCLQGIVGRSIAPIETAVVSVGHVAGGEPDGFNIIPSKLTLNGTMRYFDQEVGRTLAARMAENAEAAAKMSGAVATFTSRTIMPPLVNDQTCTQIAIAAARKAATGNVNSDLNRSTGSEDFAQMMEVVPGAFMRIGNGSNPDGTYHSVHTPLYDFNDEIIAFGARYWATLVNEATSHLSMTA